MADMMKDDNGVVYNGGSDSGSPAVGGGGGGGMNWNILLVDDDDMCLSSVARLLRECNYGVTACNDVTEALNLLQNNNRGFNMILTELYMRDMDGLMFLHRIREEMDLDLPVVVMSSSEYSFEIMAKVIDLGVDSCLMKPLRKEDVSVIWQHIVRRLSSRPSSSNNISGGGGGIVSGCCGGREDYQNNNNSSDNNNKRFNNGGEGNCGSSSSYKNGKKQRMVWTNELHAQFVFAINKIGIKNAVPKKILDFMKNPALSRENVASHLQKYRLYLKRIENQKEEQQEQNLRNNNNNNNNIPPRVQAQTIVHNQLMIGGGGGGSCTTSSQQMTCYPLTPPAMAPPPVMSNQFHSPISAVSQVELEMEMAEKLNITGGNCMNGGLFSHPHPLPLHQFSYYNNQSSSSLGYGLQHLSSPADQTEYMSVTDRDEQSFIVDNNRSIQLPCPLPFTPAESGYGNVLNCGGYGRGNAAAGYGCDRRGSGDDLTINAVEQYSSFDNIGHEYLVHHRQIYR